MQLTNTVLVSLLAASGAQAASLHRRGPMFSRPMNDTASAEPIADLADLVTKLEKEGKIKWTVTPSGAQMAEVPEAVIKEAATPTGPAMSTGTGTIKPKLPKLPKNAARAAPALPGSSGTPDLTVAGMQAKLTCAKPKEESLAAGVPQENLIQPANQACQDWAAAAASSTAGVAQPTSTGTAGKKDTAYHLWRPKAQPPQPKQPVQPGMSSEQQQQQQQQELARQLSAVVWYQSTGETKLTPEICNQALQAVSDPQKSHCTGQGHSASISMAVGGVAHLGDETKGINLGVNAMMPTPTTQEQPGQPKIPVPQEKNMKGSVARRF